MKMRQAEPLPAGESASSPWQIGSGVLVTFKTARVAWPLTARLIPVASRGVLSSWGRLLTNGRVGRGRSRVRRIVVTWYRAPLKANDAPLGVSKLQQALKG